MLERLVPSMVLQQFNILLAQIEGKAVKNKAQIYRPLKTDDEKYKAEIELIKQGYARLKEATPPTTGERLRVAVTGTSTPAKTGHLMVKEIERKYTKDN